ncbi:MAG: peptidase MA family metallohydrolase, partial [Rudaea sp.]
MKRTITWLALAGLLFIFLSPGALAQGGISASDASYKVDYPRQLQFHLAASAPSSITAITLAVRFPSTGLTTRIPAKFDSATQVNTTVNWDLRGETSTAVGGYLPPGAIGEYSWHIEDQAGDKLDTPAKPFRVDDNREPWQDLKNDRVLLYWRGFSAADGRQVFDTTNKTLDAIQSDIGATLTGQVQLFIYSDRSMFMSALSPGQKEWAGGTIEADFGIVLIDGSAGLDYVLDTAPHELTHLVIAQYLKGPYRDISMPLWMNEGLAVYHEFIPPRNEPRFDQALRRGIQTDTVFRLRTLESSFPNDESVVPMAYGEGFSVVDFMIRTYGPEKLKQIMQLFKTGSTADEAFQQVLGVNEDGLENAWRKSVGAPLKNYPQLATATPGAVPTFGFSSAATPGAVAATATAPAVAAANTPAPGSNPFGGQPGAQGGGGLCGGLFGGAGLVAFAAWRL